MKKVVLVDGNPNASETDIRGLQYSVRTSLNTLKNERGKECELVVVDVNSKVVSDKDLLGKISDASLVIVTDGAFDQYLQLIGQNKVEKGYSLLLWDTVGRKAQRVENTVAADEILVRLQSDLDKTLNKYL